MSALGFAFQPKNPGGIGAALHALMLCVSTARHHGQDFGIVQDSLQWGLLNGYDSKCPQPKTWLDYFRGPKTLPRKEIETVWTSCRGFFVEAPEWYPGSQFEWYSEILRELFQLRPEIQPDVDRRVEQSGFLPTDALVHIRRTDKILESPDIPLEKYLQAVQERVPVGTRVFICSDLLEIQVQFQKMLEDVGYPSARDLSEKESVQATRLANGGPYLESWEENLNAFKLLVMFSRASYLIGARASYLFRCGELLNLEVVQDQSRCISLEDNQKFGLAPYVRRDPRSFQNSPGFDLEFNPTEIHPTERWKVSPHFLPESSGPTLRESMAKFQRYWLSSPSWAPSMHRLKRNPGHTQGCTCFGCRMLKRLWSVVEYPICIVYFENDFHPKTYVRGTRMILFCNSNAIVTLWQHGDQVETLHPQFGTLLLLSNIEFSITKSDPLDSSDSAGSLFTFQSRVSKSLEG